MRILQNRDKISPFGSGQAAAAHWGNKEREAQKLFA
jgi:hypothetical protein